jgi:hypothetical protein
MLWERGKSAVGRCGESRGSHHPFIGLGARRRGVAGGSNGGINGFNAIEDGGEVKRGIKGGGNDGQSRSSRTSRTKPSRSPRSSLQSSKAGALDHFAPITFLSIL